MPNEPESDVMLAALIGGELQYDQVHDCLLVIDGGVAYPVVCAQQLQRPFEIPPSAPLVPLGSIRVE